MVLIPQPLRSSPLHQTVIFPLPLFNCILISSSRPTFCIAVEKFSVATAPVCTMAGTLLSTQPTICIQDNLGNAIPNRAIDLYIFSPAFLNLSLLPSTLVDLVYGGLLLAGEHLMSGYKQTRLVIDSTINLTQFNVMSSPLLTNQNGLCLFVVSLLWYRQSHAVSF